MKLTDRQMMLVSILKNSDDAVNGKTMSSLTGFSLRTIQSEMSFLRSLGMVSSGQEGYRLNDDVQIEEEENQTEQMIRKLLTEESFDYGEFADEFYLSESALKNRLSLIDTQLKPFHLKVLVNKQKISLQGTELDKRTALKKMIMKDTKNEEDFVSYFDDFDDFDALTLKDIINSSILSSGYYVQYPYAGNLILSVMVCLYRISKGSHTPESYRYDPSGNEYRLASHIADRFYDHYHIKAQESDVSYIASMFEGQIIEETKQGDVYEDMSEFESHIASLLLSTFDDYDIHLDISLYIRNFSLHVSELVKRGRFNNFVTNPSNTSMKENCPFIYDVAVHFAKKLENEYDLSIPDDEIAFLAVHIGLIISSENRQTSSVRILLVASTYHGIAQRIVDQIEEKHQNNVAIRVIDPANTRTSYEDFDLIVTTEKADLIGKKIVNITPFYNIVDRANVDAAISETIKKKEKRKEYIELMNCFSPDLFFIRKDIDTSDKAIDFLSSKLINYGIVDPDFTRTVRIREAQSPTCFFGSFAIPHSIETNAKRTMFAVLINQDGIAWNDTSVKLCLMIAICRKDLHDFSDLYDNIVRTLFDPTRYQKLIDSKTLQEFTENFRSE